MLRALSRALERWGHRVTTASDGRKGLAAFEAETPELVITDVNMPDMDGIELIIALGSRDPEVPVVGMSGGGMLAKELLLDNASALSAVITLLRPRPPRGCPTTRSSTSPSA